MKGEMTGRNGLLRFDSDALGWLDDLASSAEPVRWIGPGQLCVADAALARAILRNDGGRYADHSDFFGTEAGMFGPRPLQVEIGRRGRAMVEAHLRQANYSAAVAGLGAESRWPRAGNLLVLGLIRPVLVGEGRAARFTDLVDAIVEDGILNRDSARRGGWRRRLRRFRFFLAFSAERERRQAGAAEPRDLLDLVLAIGRDAPTEQLVEIYLGFVFALASSVGFALGWSILLTVSHGEEAELPKHIASEALRLYPVAWLFGRKPVLPHALAGVEVGPADEVMVSPYAVHRNPVYWPDPTRFAPARWREAHDRSAWLPFGAGEHTCAAVSTTFQILERVLTELFNGYSARIPQAGERPGIAAALAPPPFTLALERR